MKWFQVVCPGTGYYVQSARVAISCRDRWRRKVRVASRNIREQDWKIVCDQITRRRPGTGDRDPRLCGPYGGGASSKRPRSGGHSHRRRRRKLENPSAN